MTTDSTRSKTATRYPTFNFSWSSAAASTHKMHSQNKTIKRETQNNVSPNALRAARK
jgi:hypothetical protein